MGTAQESSQKAASAKPLASYSLVRSIRLEPRQQRILYISGTTARLPNGQIPPFGDQYDDSVASDKPDSGTKPAATLQTELILSKIASAISGATDGKASLENLVELTIFVANLERDYGAMNNAYNQIISWAFDGKDKQLPARTCVQVGAMPPDRRTLVEIKGVAIVEYS